MREFVTTENIQHEVCNIQTEISQTARECCVVTSIPVCFYSLIQFLNDTTDSWPLTPWGDQPCVVLSVSVAKQLSITVKEMSACGGC